MVKLRKGEVIAGYNPGYVNIVTYVHFTDLVWVFVMSLLYIWPWKSLGRGYSGESRRREEKGVMVKERVM